MATIDPAAQSLLARLTDRFARALARRPWLFLLLALSIGALALIPALQLRLDPRLEALFPETPAATDYREFLSRAGGLEKAFVLIESSDPTATGDDLIDASERMSELLSHSPEVAAARAGVTDRDERFFLEQVVPRAPLLLGDAAQGELAAKLTRAAIQARVRELRSALSSPSGGFTASWLAHDPLALAGPIVARRAGPSAKIVDPLSGAFLSADGKRSLVIVTPAASEIDPERGRALGDAIETAWREVNSNSRVKLTMRATGGPLFAAHDERILREDLQRTAGGSLIGVALVLLIGFAGLLLPVIEFSAVSLGLLWTVGFVALALSPLSAAGIGFAAILIGLGDNAAIHICARFRREWAAGDGVESALSRTFRGLAAATLGASLTTAAAFGVLQLAHFRPLRELGDAVAVGMILILIASFIGTGSLLAIAAPRLTHRPPRTIWRWLDRAIESAIDACRRRRRFVLSLAAAVSIAAAVGASRLSFDFDPGTLRPEDRALVDTAEQLHREFAVGLETLTLVVKETTLDRALDRAEQVSELLRTQLPPGSELFTPTDFLLGTQTASRRLAALSALSWSDARDEASRQLRLAGLAVEQFQPALSALADLPRVSPARDLWPDWLAEAVRERDGETSLLIHLRLPPDGWREGMPERLRQQIKTIAPSTAIASVPAVGRELRDVALSDFRRLGVWGALVVVVVLLLSFRWRLRALILASLPVLLGALWIFGLLGASGQPLDLMGIAVLPVLLGIGVDDGMHLVHGALLSPARSLAASAREAGRGILIANLTTVVGFSSLLASRVAGLRHAGALIALGLFASLVATLIVLPAIDRVER